MKNKIRWIAETAVLLALLITLQWATKPLGQFVTGSCVNLVLAVAVLYAGMGSGLTVALLSSVFAYFLGIAPNLVTLPAIMAGNAVYVFLLHLICGDGKALWRRLIAWLSAAAGKFAVLYALVVLLVCGPLSGTLLEQGLLMEPMLKLLPATFSWPQLVTALIGGGLALMISPILNKALHKN